MVEKKLYKEGDRFLICSKLNNKYLCKLVQIASNRFMLIDEDGNRLTNFQKDGLSVRHGLELLEVLEIATHDDKSAIILEINGVKLNSINFKKGDIISISYGKTYDKVIISHYDGSYTLVCIESTTPTNNKNGDCIMICGRDIWDSIEDLNKDLDWVNNLLGSNSVKKVSYGN